MTYSKMREENDPVFPGLHLALPADTLRIEVGR